MTRDDENSLASCTSSSVDAGTGALQNMSSALKTRSILFGGAAKLGLNLWGVERAVIQPNGQLQLGTLKYETSLGLDP